MTFSVRKSRVDEWERIRDIRLRMLADAPIAFGELLETADKYTEAVWRARAARWHEPGRYAVVAVDDNSGDWIGIMRANVDEEHGPELVGVFVDPAWRGSDLGVTDALLDRVEEWAAERGSTLTLEVHENNPRAIAFYRKRGFEPTGQSRPHEIEPFGNDVEFVKPITRG